MLVGLQQNRRDSFFSRQHWRGLAVLKSSSGRTSVEMALAGSVAVGRNFGSERLVATEGVLRMSASYGFFGLSLGARVPIGKCTVS